MAHCPDCDSVKMFCDPPEGNGKCSACHGTGFSDFSDSVEIEFLNGELSSCEECYGTGLCPTCNGSGVVEEELPIAA
jgi:DnaJ-class molecular chaperone